ncbi:MULTISPECIES: DMT family transporter [Ralstonia solanacearum species complex]|uniref:EamA domain-containing protein n=2 Tax=Ralstonia solanacearum TaxID=305 RepID=A0ABF7RBG4_RALSL|nr:DMT family transporter [Ralstonia solanacearum]ATI28032.1 EamA family transporter [Ralstonia solanacearum]NUU71811.1 DMT family transporter [Ralstonia solanacearum]OPK46329.1 EamA family transporter [Ralstonia solanacearum]OPK51525.1 EamA family transporter [Ralstonia solanacearum]OPK61030.1 EamA family transporter [Ralstonia solanacearum]
MPIHALFLIAAMALVGSNVGFGKSIVAVLPVMLFALLRFLIAVACMAPWYRPSRMRRVTRGEWTNLFLQAFFGTFGFTLLMLNGVRLTSALAAGIITSTIPATVALLSWLVLREKPSGRTLVSVVLAVAGVALLNGYRGGESAGAAPADAAQALLGNALVMGAVLCESVYITLSRRLTQTLPAIEICAYTHLIGALLMLPLGLVPLLTFDLSTVPPHIWGLVVWYALSASIFSFWLWMKGIRHVPAHLAGVFTSVLPIAAAAYGIIALGETPGWAHGVALACVVAGILVASWPARPRRTVPRGRIPDPLDPLDPSLDRD